MKEWLAIYYHRFGIDFFFIRHPEMPSDEEMVNTYTETEWELEREDEYQEYYDITNMKFDRLKGENDDS